MKNLSLCLIDDGHPRLNDLVFSLERRGVALRGRNDHALVKEMELLALKEANIVGCFSTVFERDCAHETTSRGGGRHFHLGLSLLGGHEWHGVELRFERRSHGATHLGSLDLLASHVDTKLATATEKGLVVVGALVAASSQSVKTI